MRFEPKTEREVAEAGLLAPGEYDCECIEGVDDVSKAGNDMIKLRLRVFDADGGTRLITDYLMEKVAYKLRHACFAFGLGEQYEAGRLEGADFTGRSARVKVAIRKDKTGQYPDQNSIADYLVDEAAPNRAAAPARQAASPRQMADLDDEIPF